MSTNPPSDADLVAAFTADADQAISAAVFMRRHEDAFRGQPGRRKPSLTRLAPVFSVALIVAVAVIITITRSSGGGSTRPSGTAGCAADFTLAVAGELQSLPPDVGFSLTYIGSSPCTLLLAPPKVTIINGGGNQMGATTGGPVAGHTYPSVTVGHGDELAFGIGAFLGCYETPPNHYIVVILTPTAHGTSAAVKVPLTISGSPHSAPSPNTCATSKIGDVSPLTVTPNRTGPTGVLSGRLAAVGGPAPGLPRPLPGSVQITNTQTHNSRVVSVSADGRYSVAVTPGTYLVVGRSPEYNGGTEYDCHAEQPAIVHADQTTPSDVYCQEN